MARAAKNPSDEQSRNEHGLTGPQEVFAQLVASGRSQAEAHRTAYPKSQKWKQDAVYVAASQLMANHKVSIRVAALRAEITQRAIEEAKVDKTFVLNGLKTVAKRCLQAAPVLDRKGMPVIIEVEGKDGDIGLAPAFTFEPAGANRAFELLGKEIGMFVERKETGRPGEFAHLTDAEVEQQAKEAVAAAVKGGYLKLVKTGSKQSKSA